MKQVLITGASTGIGFDITKTLCEKGYRVWATVRNPKVLERIKEDYGDRLSIIQMDVTHSKEIQEAVEFVKESLNPKQEFILINNAGIANGGPIEALSLSEWRNVFDVNLFAMVEMTRSFLPILRETKGRVINIGSISGRIASPFLGPYSASKFAVRAFSDSLRREMSYFDVKVALIEPGPIRTEIWSKSIRASDEAAKKFPPGITETYGPLMESLREGVIKTAEGAVPVQKVTEAVIHAIESRSPQVSYLIGRHIRLQATLARFLPSGAMDRLMKAGLRFQKG